MNKLEILNFIERNENWEELLKQEPYHLKIKKDDKNRYIFNYNQIFSKEKLEIVKEARGLILKKTTNGFKVVCAPFYRFFNYGQEAAAEIDWDTAEAQEKIDGSIIKVWYDEEWMISTNGLIDAREADLVANIFYSNFYDLVIAALELEKDFIGFNNLDKEDTHIFEVCSPYNKIISSYPLSIYHIGSRNNITQKEFIVDIGVKKPKSFLFNSLEDCISNAKSLPFNEEGYVICDDNFNRIKVKSPSYILAHRMRGNECVQSENNLLSLILIGEKDEFLSYFPEYRNTIIEIEEKINLIEKDMEKIINQLTGKSRKEVALELENSIFRDYLIKVIFGNEELTFLNYLQNCSLKRAFSILKSYTNKNNHLNF